MLPIIVGRCYAMDFLAIVIANTIIAEGGRCCYPCEKLMADVIEKWQME